MDLCWTEIFFLESKELWVMNVDGSNQSLLVDEVTSRRERKFRIFPYELSIFFVRIEIKMMEDIMAANTKKINPISVNIPIFIP